MGCAPTTAWFFSLIFYFYIITQVFNENNKIKEGKCKKIPFKISSKTANGTYMELYAFK